jgi:two-component system sensor histidine kinase MprB
VSLRARMTVAGGVAVAIAVIAVALSAYEGTRSTLRGQLDTSLRALSEPFTIRARELERSQERERAGNPPGPAQALAQPTIAGFAPAGGDCDEGLGLDDRAGGPGYGGARGYVELVRRDGSVCLAADERVVLPVAASIQRLARSGRGAVFLDERAANRQMRVLATGVGPRGAIMVGLQLAPVQSALHSELLLLVIIAASGIALAALLGVLVGRTAVAPITRFTRQTEQIAENPDLIGGQRIEVHGSDELARLGRTFNATLDALERSVVAQRNLVADASHELRTPIASIRANLQLMRDEDLLSPVDRQALRNDIIAELDELTALVSDVVELARGSKLSREPGDVRLDEIVAAAVQRARRRAPQLRFEADLEPTLITGDGELILRAVSNLLDNATKWSPDDERVEITLARGVVSVRDHGPGFDAEDLPFVFDRFHRARRARSKPGSGLGLAIVRQAAEAHAGFAEAHNAHGGGALLRVGFGPPLSLRPQGEPVAGARTLSRS